MANSALKNEKVGWHDDNFSVATYSEGSTEDWYFYNRLVDRNLQNYWQKVVIGGEVQPGIQDQLFDSSKSCSDCQPFIPAVQATHATWLLYYNIFQKKLGSKTAVVAAAREGAAHMGYGIHVPEVQFDKCATASNKCVKVTIHVQNIGVAPFYYPLELKAKIDSGGWVSITTELGSLLPSSTSTVYEKEMTVEATGTGNTTSGHLTLALSSSQVLPTQTLLFSNEELTSDGEIELAFSVDNGQQQPSSASSALYSSCLWVAMLLTLAQQLFLLL